MRVNLLIGLIIVSVTCSCENQPKYTVKTYEDTIFRLKKENDLLKLELEKCDDWVDFLESDDKQDSLFSNDSVLISDKKSIFNKILSPFKFRENRKNREHILIYRRLDSLIEIGEIKKGDIKAEEIELMLDSIKSIELQPKN